MNSTEFKNKLKSGLDKIFNSSKAALGKAGNAVQDFSDKSVIRIEKHQLETKKDEQIEKLGRLAYEKFRTDDAAKLSASEEAVVAVMQEIAALDTEIEKKNELLKKEDKDTKETKKTPEETEQAASAAQTSDAGTSDSASSEPESSDSAK